VGGAASVASYCTAPQPPPWYPAEAHKRRGHGRRPRVTPSPEPVFSELVRELLAAEEKRRESLEARGASVITVSGTLVTLLVGIAAVATRANSFDLSATAGDRLSGAAVAFVVAALLAIAAYAPQPTRITDPDALIDTLPDLWERGEDFAYKKATRTRLEQLSVSQRTNDWKARAVLAAVVAQVVAVILLAWAVLGAF
jgi:hypothetical protein